MAAKNHRDEHDASPADYRNGTKTFSFDSSVYAATEVKDALRTAQHHKCAFCESSFDHVAYGDIEHFRPKAGYKQKEADDLKRPGYYWLAYEWANLFYSCQLCNQRFKRNLFPLKDGRRRARSRTHNLAKEEPLLIDPAAHDPSLYIGFHKEYAYPVGECPEGVATIDILGLNREELAEKRAQRLRDLEALARLCELLREKVAQGSARSAELVHWESILRHRLEATSEYSAMTRAFLA